MTNTEHVTSIKMKWGQRSKQQYESFSRCCSVRYVPDYSSWKMFCFDLQSWTASLKNISEVLLRWDGNDNSPFYLILFQLLQLSFHLLQQNIWIIYKWPEKLLPGPPKRSHVTFWFRFTGSPSNSESNLRFLWSLTELRMVSHLPTIEIYHNPIIPTGLWGSLIRVCWLFLNPGLKLKEAVLLRLWLLNCRTVPFWI